MRRQAVGTDGYHLSPAGATHLLGVHIRATPFPITIPILIIPPEITLETPITAHAYAPGTPYEYDEVRLHDAWVGAMDRAA